MTSNTRRQPRRPSLISQAYEWLHSCDLAQLDAIIVAVFVLVVGIGILGSCYVLGFVEMRMHNTNAPVQRWATMPHVDNSYAAYNTNISAFGKPRYGAESSPAGQAQAAGLGGM
jgi:hypothetical protein